MASKSDRRGPNARPLARSMLFAILVVTLCGVVGGSPLPLPLPVEGDTIPHPPENGPGGFSGPDAPSTPPILPPRHGHHGLAAHETPNEHYQDSLDIVRREINPVEANPSKSSPDFFKLIRREDASHDHLARRDVHETQHEPLNPRTILKRVTQFDDADAPQLPDHHIIHDVKRDVIPPKIPGAPGSSKLIRREVVFPGGDNTDPPNSPGTKPKRVTEPVNDPQGHYPPWLKDHRLPVDNTRAVIPPNSHGAPVAAADFPIFLSAQF